MQAAYAEAKKAHDTIYQEENFDAYAAANRLSALSADFFLLNKPPQAFASVKDLAAQLAGLEKNDISKVLAGDDGYYVIRIEDKKAAYTPKLKEIEADVRRAYLAARQVELAAEEAAGLLEKVRQGESLEKLASAKGLKIEETGLFQPGETIPKLGANSEAMEAILSLSLSHPYPEKPLAINSAYVIFKLKEVGPLDMKDFEAKKDVYRKVAMNLKREEAMTSWLQGNKTAMIKRKRLKINKEAQDL